MFARQAVTAFEDLARARLPTGAGHRFPVEAVPAPCPGEPIGRRGAGRGARIGELPVTSASLWDASPLSSLARGLT